MFHLDLRSDLNFDTVRLSVNALDQASLCIISNLMALFNVRPGQSVLDNFNQYQIGTTCIIVNLSTD